VQQGECLSEDCGCDEEIDSSEAMVSSMGSLMPDIEGPHHGRVAVGDARETWMRTCRESSLCLGLACDRRMRTAPNCCMRVSRKLPSPVSDNSPSQGD